MSGSRGFRLVGLVLVLAALALLAPILSIAPLSAQDAVVVHDGFAAESVAPGAEEPSGDEEEHADTGAIGDLIWRDTNNNGRVDVDEPGIGGVVVNVYDDANRDGAPDDDVIVGSAESDDAGTYAVEGLENGSYVLVVPASNWDVGRPLYGCASSDTTTVDPSDGMEDDDNGVTVVGMGLLAGPVTITADATVDTTIDFGCFAPQFDLSLSLVPLTESPVVVGDTVSVQATVLNQGSVSAEEIMVTAYLPAEFELADDAWTAGDAGANTVLDVDVLGPDESVSAVLSATVLASGVLTIGAEISSASSTARMPNGAPFPDVDSFADAIDDDPIVDDETADDGTFDEDDHDVVQISANESAEDEVAPDGHDPAGEDENAVHPIIVRIPFPVFVPEPVLIPYPVPVFVPNTVSTLIDLCADPDVPPLIIEFVCGADVGGRPPETDGDTVVIEIPLEPAPGDQAGERDDTSDPAATSTPEAPQVDAATIEIDHVVDEVVPPVEESVPVEEQVPVEPAGAADAVVGGEAVAVEVRGTTITREPEPSTAVAAANAIAPSGSVLPQVDVAPQLAITGKEPTLGLLFSAMMVVAGAILWLLGNRRRLVAGRQRTR